MQTPIPSSGTPVQLTLLSWPDSTPEEGREREKEGKRLKKEWAEREEEEMRK